MTIRQIKKNQIILLTDFIYEAIFQRDSENLAPRTIIQEPGVWAYIDGFNTKKDDHCLVAEVDGKIVGAVWVRCIDGYGKVDSKTPEFAISLYPQYRGKGIGTALMRAMLDYLKKSGYTKTSLAVQKDNYAVKMYKNVGFETIGENEEGFIMVCKL